MDNISIKEQNEKLFLERNNLDLEIEKFYKNLSEMIMKYKIKNNTIPNKEIFLNMRKERVKQKLEQIKRNLIICYFWIIGQMHCTTIFSLILKRRDSNGKIYNIRE